jgi:NADPH:quinone reductase-like Zn-dependent oxidoreductase
MRAVVSGQLGAAPELTEVPTPTAGPGEIRVKVAWSSWNGFDSAVVNGWMSEYMEHRFPVVLGRDFAGTVDQIGDGVTAFSVGQDVFGVVLTSPLSAGGFGEYLVIPQDHSVTAVPDGLPLESAGVIGLAGSAATAVINATEVGPGDVVLVVGATGGVGALAMQMAAQRGATVIATATPDEVEHVRGLGAQHAVDHRGGLTSAVRQLAPDGVDVALHMAGDAFEVAGLVRSGGRFATLLGIPAEAFSDLDIVAHSTAAYPAAPVLAQLGRDVAAGRLRMPVQNTYSLAAVPQAFADFTAGTRGKLAVQVGQSQ